MSCTCTQAATRQCGYKHACTHTHTHTRTHARTHTHTHTRMHTHKHTHTHTHTYRYTLLCTHVRKQQAAISIFRDSTCDTAVAHGHHCKIIVFPKHLPSLDMFSCMFYFQMFKRHSKKKVPALMCFGLILQAKSQPSFYFFFLFFFLCFAAFMPGRIGRREDICGPCLLS